MNGHEPRIVHGDGRACRRSRTCSSDEHPLMRWLRVALSESANLSIHYSNAHPVASGIGRDERVLLPNVTARLDTARRGTAPDRSTRAACEVVFINCFPDVRVRAGLRDLRLVRREG